MNKKRITTKCEYVSPSIEVINVVDMNTLLAGSPFLDNGHEPGEPDLNPLEEESLYEDNPEMLY
ncbi:hypothetical protein [Hallella bergensis]|uniref:hypothetical protein n=1 Tax=Hallella bergensis TaxID=242750 RepID=UPI0001BCEC56|nr:hypothetical protein [Hallella bergensis]